MADERRALAAPCKSCPYRQDVPSGVWAPREYLRLLDYDKDMMGQVAAGATGLFLCHQKNGCICSGWLATHGTRNLLGLRLARDLDPAVFDYETDVPVFASGREACLHGLRDIEDPGPEAMRVMDRVAAKRERAHG